MPDRYLDSNETNEHEEDGKTWPDEPETSAKRSFWRRLVLLSLLHLRPHTNAEIIEVLDKLGLLEYDRFENPALIAQRQQEQFTRDRNALKASGCQIKHDRRTELYTWHNSPFKLGLDESQFQAFVLLLQTFDNSQIPYSAQIQDLLTHLSKLLPDEQKLLLQSQRPAFSIKLHETTDYRQADKNNLEQIEKAIRNRQQLEFKYGTPRDGKIREHLVEPRPLVFERGHVYFKGWSVKWNKEWSFRLDYVVPGSARMLPNSSAPGRPRNPSYELKYWLSPQIARHKVSHHFPEQQVEQHLDGSATVTAQITDLFEARRLLVGYFEHCKILSPPELIEEMRQALSSMYQIYSS